MTTGRRSYRSPLRERRANATRRKIADAAERLLVARGYADMTVKAIAREAGVAQQTVYAVFGSKRGILAALLSRTAYEDDFAELVERARNSSSVYESLRVSVSLTRRIYESETDARILLRGAGVLDLELARVEEEFEALRREHIEAYVEDALFGQLRPGMDLQTAQDIFWALTSRDIYRMLAHERKWTGDAYERWLLRFLASALLGTEEAPPDMRTDARADMPGTEV